MQRMRTLTDYGLKIKYRLLKLNITQKELCKKLGITEQYLIDILYGGRHATEMKNKIENCLDELEVYQN